MQRPTHCVAEPPRTASEQAATVVVADVRGPGKAGWGQPGRLGKKRGVEAPPRWGLPLTPGGQLARAVGAPVGEGCCRRSSERLSQVLSNDSWLCAGRVICGRGSLWSPSALHPVCPRGLPCGVACHTAGCTSSLLRQPRQLQASCAFPR